MTFLATKVYPWNMSPVAESGVSEFGLSKLELSDRANFISLMKISSGTPMETENS